MKSKDIQDGVCYSFERKHYTPSRVWVLSTDTYYEVRRWYNRSDTAPFAKGKGEAVSGVLVLMTQQDNLSEEDLEWASQMTVEKALTMRNERGYGVTDPRKEFRFALVALRLIIGEWNVRQVELAEEERVLREQRKARKSEKAASLVRAQELVKAITELGGTRKYYLSDYDLHTDLKVSLDDLELLVKLAQSAQSGD